MGEESGGIVVGTVGGDFSLQAGGDIVTGNKTVINNIIQRIARELTTTPYKFLASYDDKDGCLVVKLPRQRVSELVENGDGDPFAPAGKVFREWVSIPTIDRTLWHTLLAEAVDFARQGLAE